MTLGGVGLLVGAAWGAGFEVAEQGAAAGGAAHAGTAVRHGAESAWFNPALLADDGGFRVAVGATLATSRVTMFTPTGQVRSDTPLGTPPYLALSVARGPVAGSVSVQVPFGGGIRWPSDGLQRFESVLSKPQFFRVTGSFAARFGPVSLAAGAHVDAGSLRVERATDHVSEEGYLTLAVRGVGLGGDAAIAVDAGRHVTIGATYKSRTKLPLAGEVDFDVPPAFATTRPDQAVSAAWTLPDRITLGASWHAERWWVTLEGDLTLWSVNDTLAFDFADPATTDAVQQNRWRDTVAVRAGAAARVHDLVELRGGAYVDLPGAPPAAYLGPSSPDATRLAVTAGLGVRPHRAVRLDVFGEPILLLERESASLDLPIATYRGWAFAAGLGVSAEMGWKRPAARDADAGAAAPSSDAPPAPPPTLAPAGDLPPPATPGSSPWDPPPT
jgi:long-subunit fatty acid transport protein